MDSPNASPRRSTAVYAGDVSHATAALAEFGDRHWEAKSAHDVARFTAFFSPTTLFYGDAAFGVLYDMPDAVCARLAELMPGWGDGVSYGLRMLGDEHSAVVVVRDSPEMFGSEIVLLSAVDFDDRGKVVRWIDYHDLRNFGVARVARLRAPAEKWATLSFGEERIGSGAGQPMPRVVESLAASLAATRPESAARLFTPEATFEDMTARTRVHGAAAISRYLLRAAHLLPYGLGSHVRHVLGNELGGGYEWGNPHHAAERGITALELAPDGRISDLVAVWDGSLVTPAALSELAVLGLDLEDAAPEPDRR